MRGRQRGDGPPGHDRLLRVQPPTGAGSPPGGSDNTARVWDGTTGKLVRTFPHSSVVESVAFDPAGALLLTGSRDGTAQLWNVPQGDPASEPLRHPSTASGVTFDRSGRLALVAALDGLVHLWDVRTGLKIGWPAAMGNSWGNAGTAPVVRADNARRSSRSGVGPVREFALPKAVTASSADIEEWCRAITGLTNDGKGRIKPNDVPSRWSGALE